MQRFLLSLLILLCSSALFAQTVDEIEELVKKGDWEKAKTSVDAFLSKEKNTTKADGWWFKGLIYNEMAKNDKYKSQMPNGRMDAFNAFKKYYELDSKAVRGTLEQHVRLFDIYNQYFTMGVEGFNSSNFEDAYTNFKNAYAVEEYISGKGWEYNGFKFSAFDTSLIQNIALSAYKANKEDEAAVYYKKIADQKIVGEDFPGVYDWMIKYYAKKGDNANKEKYLQLAKQVYPNISWEASLYEDELKKIDPKDKKALFAKYDELIPKYSKEYFLYYNYAVELFNYIYKTDPKPTDYKALQSKIENILMTAIDIDKSIADANFLLAAHYYNLVFDTQDELKTVKTTTAADQKKKADINTRTKEVADKVITYGTAAINAYTVKEKLTTREKGNYRQVLGFVSDAYDVKGDKAKAEEYKKKGDALN